MKKNSFILILLLILSGCGIITIVSGEFEDVDKFKVNLDTKPSALICQYTGDSSYLNKKNFFITFFDIYCGFSYQQINLCNLLYKDTKDSYEWLAITIYDSIADEKYRKIEEYPIGLRYKYKTYYEVNGLKTSLRNLYFRNKITDPDIVPMSMVIVNDSIVRIKRGAINNNTIYEELKTFMDSCTNSQNTIR